MVMLLTSCSKEIIPREINTDPTFVFETDAWSGYNVRELHIMTESEDSYYYVALDCYVHVIDKKRWSIPSFVINRIVNTINE